MPFERYTNVSPTWRNGRCMDLVTNKLNEYYARFWPKDSQMMDHSGRTQ